MIHRCCVAATLMLLCSGCMVGPKYKRPSAPLPTAFKEPPPAGWKEAQPSDGALRGKWWEIYNDPALNELEERISISNQNVLAAEAQFREAKSLVRVARAGLFPTLTTSPSIVASRAGSGSAAGVTTAVPGTISNVSPGTSSVRTNYDLPVSFSYQADLWGSIRRTVRAQTALAQASAAQLENARLTYQAELATDYFLLHGSDSNMDLLERTVASYTDYLKLTQDRYRAGVASGGDVAQAEAQLYGTQASLVDLQTLRAQYEHAIAVLTGRPPAQIEIPRLVLKSAPPQIPVGVPSTLLERRPDIANFERQMAAANEQIGIAQAAFYPSLTITASGGFISGSIVDWFTWPSRFWSVGPAMSELLFDGGRRRATVAEYQAAFDYSVANYRQTVLTAFQQVEDSLAALRVLEDEAVIQARAVQAADASLQITTFQYKAGTVNYLSVITAQATALAAERTAVDLLTRRLTASVQLIEALGGGWDPATIPSEGVLVSGTGR